MQKPTRNNYRGVACSRCSEPIPVSPKLAGSFNERNGEETNATHSFSLRCRICEEEGIYTVTDIRDIVGEPTRRRIAVQRKR